MIELFWNRMQVELLDRRIWRTRVELANGLRSIAGTTAFDWWFVHLDVAGRLSRCDAMGKKSNALGGRDVVVSCLGGHGVLSWRPGVPGIHHLVQIQDGRRLAASSARHAWLAPPTARRLHTTSGRGRARRDSGGGR